MTERLERRLGDLVEFGKEAAYLTGLGLDAYLAADMTGAILRNAGERILIKVATVVEKLPADYKAQYPEVDWVGITRMRNLVAHHYDKINDDLIWQALTVRVPELMAALGLGEHD